MKIKIMMMLAAVLIIGAAEATRYQSATTFVGDITMREAGIEMAGNRISNVTWSSYGWYIFDGTTGAELKAFIDANGPGTYYFTQPIEVSEQLIFDQEFVRIKAPFPGAPWTDSRARFNITTDTNPAIDIQNQYIVFEDCVFAAHNKTTTNTLTRVSSDHVHFVNCDWNANNATGGVVRVDEAFGTHIIDPWISMPYGGSGIGIALISSNKSRHTLATYISNNGYSRGIYYGDTAIYCNGYIEAPYFDRVMSFKSRHGLYMVPIANQSILNVEIDHCNFDFTEECGTCITFAADVGYYEIIRVRLSNCALYSAVDGGFTVESKVPLSSFQIVGGYYQADSVFGSMEFDSLIDSHIIGAEIWCPDSNAIGIHVKNGQNFSIVGNTIRTTAKSIKIDAGSSYIVASNMARGGITDTPGAMVTSGNVVS